MARCLRCCKVFNCSKERGVARGAFLGAGSNIVKKELVTRGRKMGGKEWARREA